MAFNLSVGAAIQALQSYTRIFYDFGLDVSSRDTLSEVRLTLCMVADMLSNWRNNLSRLQHYTLTMEGHLNSVNPEHTRLHKDIFKDGKDERAINRTSLNSNILLSILRKFVKETSLKHRMDTI